jgi:hypothetical protein
MLKGDIQGAIHKLHSSEPKPEKKASAAKPESEKPGILGSLFGKK